MRPAVFIVIIVPLAFAALLAPGCGSNVELELLQKFQAAQQAFDKAQSPEDFRKVAASYREILDRGGKCGAVYYNQGNAWMRAGCPGRAIAAYRQANRYRPNDPFLEANLRYALAAEAVPAGRRPVVEYLLFWQNWLGYPAKFYLATAAAGVTFILAVLALFAARKLFSRLAVAGLVLTALLAFSAGYDWYRFDHVIRGVIAQNDVVARKGNAESYQPAFTDPLGEGTEFRVLHRRRDWLLIRLDGGQEGWIEDDKAVVY